MIYLGAILLACQGTTTDEDVTTDMDADTDTDADTDQDPDTDTDVPDTDTDTGAAGGLAALIRVGTAVVEEGVSYAGTEDLTFNAEDGYGSTVCLVSTTLASVAVRTDCATCDWAFDLVTSGSTVVTEVDGACLPLLGVDAATVGQLDGEERSYGFNPDFFAHSPVLMVYDGTAWVAAEYADYDPVTGALAYDWDDGTHAY